MALTAGDQGYKLIDQTTGHIIEMTAEQVEYQKTVIMQALDEHTLSRPVMFGMTNDSNTLSYFAGALALYKRGAHPPTVRIGKDTAVMNNATLKKILSPWPTGVQFIDEADFAKMRFLALTRTVQAQAVEFEARQESQGQVAYLENKLQTAETERAALERKLAWAMAQLPARTTDQLSTRQPIAVEDSEPPEGVMVPYKEGGMMVPYKPQPRRPTTVGADMFLVANWYSTVAAGGPKVLRAAVREAVAPGGFRPHANYAWEHLAAQIESYAEAAVRGDIPKTIFDTCQLALDDFVLAAGSVSASHHSLMRNQWAAKAEGPRAIVAAHQLRAYGRPRDAGYSHDRRAIKGCYKCGKMGRFAAQCRSQTNAKPAGN